MKKGKLIVIEGLDCSFKETVSNYIVDIFRQVNMYNAMNVSFPLYGKPSCFYISNYLQGTYKNLNLTNYTKSMIFMLEMMHAFQTQLLKEIEKGNIVILDRYWYSNIFYQTIGEDTFIKNGCLYGTEDFFEFVDLAKQFKLPEPDLCIFMDNTFSNIKKLLTIKKNKDMNENNLEYLEKVYLRYHDFLNFIIEDIELYNKSNIVKCYTRTGRLKGKSTIKKEIKEILTSRNLLIANNYDYEEGYSHGSSDLLKDNDEKNLDTYSK